MKEGGRTILQEEKEKLIWNVKKSVKHLMEESVTKKSQAVHEQSSNVSAVCSSVDNCLQFGLRRRSLGLFKTNSSSALLSKISKECEEALHIIKRLDELEKLNKTSSLSQNSGSGNESSRSFTFKSTSSLDLTTTTKSNRFYWIKIALFEKQLHKIITFLVTHSERFYDCDKSIVGDPELGPILTSLMVGPCALEFTRMNSESYWFDPPADELVQRHRISSLGRTSSTNTPSKSVLKKALSSQISEIEVERRGSTPVQAREYVESLHQNSSQALLYGKNNVSVVRSAWPEPQLGYLSLHQSASTVLLKWSPNSLMDANGQTNGNTTSWQQALSINMATVLFIHCHQSPGQGESGRLVCVGVDGVQQPHLTFPPGDNLLTFLTCLETALMPQASLSPSLCKPENTNNRKLGNATLFRRKSKDIEIQDEDSEPNGKDSVFKIIYKQGSCEDLKKISNSSNGSSFSGDWFTNLFNKKNSTCSSSDDHNNDDLEEEEDEEEKSLAEQLVLRSPSVPIKGLCHTMKKQIISRAFYGWLSYCRHMRTIRKHLDELVLLDTPEQTEHFNQGLTSEVWSNYKKLGKLESKETQRDVVARIYFGGIQPSLRKEVWPFLLGHSSFGQSVEETLNKESHLQSSYEQKLSEWGALEAIVQQQDRETTAANIARLSIDIVAEAEDKPESYPHSPTPDRPSTITEVTEYSSADNKKTSISSSEDFPTDQVHVGREVRIRSKTSWRSKISASDEGIEDINEDCCSHSSQPCLSTLQLSTMYKVTTPSIDSGHQENSSPPDNPVFLETEKLIARCIRSTSEAEEPELSFLSLKLPAVPSPCPSPASSEGGVYTPELLQSFSLNLHRIEKDVARCDRTLEYFSRQENLDRLRNIVTTWVWEHLDTGYMQGMCDIVAPLLVVIDDEVTVYSCFSLLMERMIHNFPTGEQMDHNFANMRVLMQVLDQSLYDNIQQNGDFSHFYFCYRWFLLDFKREFSYPRIYRVWETIWAAGIISSPQFYLFIALSLVETYRDIIIDRNMDFTDIIKFFNEMAEHHDEEEILQTARDMVNQMKSIVMDT